MHPSDPIQTSLISASKKVHAGVTIPLLQGWSEKNVSISWTGGKRHQMVSLHVFFLNKNTFFRFPKVLSFLSTPFPTLRKQKGILLTIPLKKETETETQRTTACCPRHPK